MVIKDTGLLSAFCKWKTLGLCYTATSC